MSAAISSRSLAKGVDMITGSPKVGEIGDGRAFLMVIDIGESNASSQFCHFSASKLHESVGLTFSERSLRTVLASSEWNEDLAEKKKLDSKILSGDLGLSAPALAAAINVSNASPSCSL